MTTWHDVVEDWNPGALELESYASEAAKTLKLFGYDAYLKTVWWAITRELALTAASNQCEFCSSDTRLHVHHLNYEHLGEELPADLIVLCWSCHADAHEFPKRGSEIHRFAAARDAITRERLEAKRW